VRQLLPEPDPQVAAPAATAGDGADEDVAARVVGADPRPRPGGRPWVVVNMIATADGATAVGGVSGPIGAPPDRAMFAALRGVADVVLVAAGTARAEGYGPPRARPDGRPGPRLAVVTRSGDLDPAARLFEAGRPLVLTCEACPPERRQALAGVAEVVLAGGAAVDPAAALAALADRGADIVLCEGGPSLNGQLVAADLVDEWCLTTAPLLASGTSARATAGPEPPGGPRRFRLARLHEAGGLLLARYVRDSP
jgi:riboflavin biosynthesis pyrimidine reductase